MNAERDLAEAIHREMVADGMADRALELWGERTGLGTCQQMQRVLRIVATDAINTVLTRRQREAPPMFDPVLARRQREGES